ncbi:borealin-like [Topomyia yanbarensis]|uniref:borealin-like n=1 Tax=Topomyia yanbarensis TaxID=2498891 RepID=UPI00273AE80F|nr:borealin-like [Topomyia yanbarensis]XP_058835700.1 borealin-like [Topomyia yanbarensis]XP_058835701.1 borealin-like [Topomyia yanbarensis]
MVRTKPSRNGNTKRNRTSFQEEKLNAKLRDFDILASSMLASLESTMMEELDKITRIFQTERKRLPKRMLEMRMDDLKLMGIQPFSDFEKLAMDTCDTLSSMNSNESSRISLQVANDKGAKHSKSDEGYRTDDSAISSVPSDVLSSAKARPYGPLASAMKNRRRSKSVSNHTTPAKGHSSLLLGIKSKKTFGGSQSLLGDNSRLSRPKYRTPCAGHRLQAVSADRGMSLITPKVQPNTPLALMRHARIGESIYSVTGSPVITAAAMEETANVNIPVANGVLSIRPTEMDSIDPGLLQKIDTDTLENLKKLQMNLNKIMQIAEENNFMKSGC